MTGAKVSLKRKLTNIFKMRYNNKKIIVKNRYKAVIICYMNIC